MNYHKDARFDRRVTRAAGSTGHCRRSAAADFPVNKLLTAHCYWATRAELNERGGSAALAKLGPVFIPSKLTMTTGLYPQRCSP